MECFIWLLNFMIIDQGPWCMRIKIANNILLSQCVHWNTCLDNVSLGIYCPLIHVFKCYSIMQITNWIVCWKWFIWLTSSKLRKMKTWTSYYPGHMYLHTSPIHIRLDRFRPRDDTVPRCYSYHTFLYTPHHTCYCCILKRFNNI